MNTPNNNQPTKKPDDISEFFLYKTPEEQKELITKVIRKTNEDQLKMVREAEALYSTDEPPSK